MKVCHACKKELALGREIGRRDECPFCHADLRCCLNCRFHDIASYNDCAEPAAERVLEKDAANFCDYFSPSGAGSVMVTTRASSSPDGLTELEKLFRKH